MNRPSSGSPVVCGVDPSPEAATAARVAGRVAALLDRPLALVHAAPRPLVSDRPHESRAARQHEQEAFDRAGYVHTVLEPLEVAGPARVERLVEWGAPDEALRSVARRLAAELIVVGTRGQGPLEDVLVPGSTSTGLARDAPVPVVVSPRRRGDDDARLPGGALLCGVDDSELSVAAAREAGRLAERLGVTLVLVAVDAGSDDPAAGDASAAAAAEEVASGVEIRTESSRGSVAEELLAASARHDAGLIAVGSRGRGPLASALLGSVTRTLLRQSDRPVLVVSRSATHPGRPA